MCLMRNYCNKAIWIRCSEAFSTAATWNKIESQEKCVSLWTSWSIQRVLWDLDFCCQSPCNECFCIYLSSISEKSCSSNMGPWMVRDDFVNHRWQIIHVRLNKCHENCTGIDSSDFEQLLSTGQAQNSYLNSDPDSRAVCYDPEQIFLISCFDFC